MSNIAVYARQQEGNATLFQVVPADGPKFWPLIAVGVAVLLIGFFSGMSVLLVLLISAACILLGWYDLRPVEHRTAAVFRVTPNAIEALGETFAKADIEELAIGSGYDSDGSPLARIGAALARFQQTQVDQVTQSLRLRSGARSVVLAGGLDPRVASLLLSEVQGVLDGAQSPTSADDLRLGHSESMKPGDLLLREIEFGVYQLERVTASGYDIVMAVPFKDDLEATIRFAFSQPGDHNLWLQKIADRGGPPVIVPRSILESPGFAPR